MKRSVFLPLLLLCGAFVSCGPGFTPQSTPLYHAMSIDSISQITHIPQAGTPIHIFYHYAFTRFEPAEIFQSARIRAMADGEIYSSFKNTTWRDTIDVVVPMNDTYAERQINVEISFYDHTNDVWGEWSGIFSAVQEALPAHQPQRLTDIEKRDILVAFNGQCIAIETVDTPSALALKAMLTFGDLSLPVWVANNVITTKRSGRLCDCIPLNPIETKTYAGDVFYADGMLSFINETDKRDNGGSLIRIGRIRKKDLPTFRRFCYEGHDDQVMTFSLSEYKRDKTE